MPKITINDFQNLTEIYAQGHGAFGVVYKAVLTKTKRCFALKKMSKANLIKQNMISQINTEIKILRDLKFENIIKLYDCFEDDEDIYLVLELAENGQLFDKLRIKGRFSEQQVKVMIKDVIAAVEYLHSQSPPIIHRDIKPENLLLDKNNRIKLADFGWSNFLNKPRKTYCGTVDYLAPEMIEKSGHNDRLDIWCIGILVYELLTGQTPFLGNSNKKNQHEIYQNILNVRIQFPSDFPPQAKDFILGMVKRNPKERMSFEAIKKHPWLQQHDFQSGPPSKIFQPIKVAKSEAQVQKVQSQQLNAIIKNLKNKISQMEQEITKYKVKEKMRKQIEPEGQQALSKDQEINKLYIELRKFKVAEQMNEKYKKQEQKMWDEINVKDKEIVSLKMELKQIEDERSQFNQLKNEKQKLQDKLKRVQKQLRTASEKNRELEGRLEEANSGFQQRVKNGEKIGLQQVNQTDFVRYLVEQTQELSSKFQESKLMFARMIEKDRQFEEKEEELAKLKSEQTKMRQTIRAELRQIYENQKDEILEKARRQLQEERDKFFQERDELKAMYEENGRQSATASNTTNNRQQDLMCELRNIKQLNKAYERMIQKQSSQIQDLKQQLKRKK